MLPSKRLRVVAPHGEKVLTVKVRFWADDISSQRGGRRRRGVGTLESSLLPETDPTGFRQRRRRFRSTRCSKSSRPLRSYSSSTGFNCIWQMRPCVITLVDKRTLGCDAPVENAWPRPHWRATWHSLLRFATSKQPSWQDRPSQRPLRRTGTRHLSTD